MFVTIALSVLPLLLWLIYHKLNTRFPNLTPVKGNDAFWLLDNEQNRMIINSFVPIQGQLSAEKFRQRLLETTEKYPKAHQRVVYRNEKPYWETVELNVNYHIRVEDNFFDKAAIQQYLNDVWDQPLSVEHPQWQYVFFSNYEGGSAYLCRIHHVYGDGVAMIGFLMELIDEEGFKMAKSCVPQPRGFKAAASVVMKACQLLQVPLLLLWKAVRPADANLFRGKQLTGKRRIDWNDISLDLVKKVKNTFGVTVNDVLMCCISAAVRKFIEKYDPKAAIDDVHVNVPISVRGKLHKYQLDNKFSLLQIPLATKQTDILSMLRATAANMTAAKQSAEPIGIYLAMKLICLLPPSLSLFIVEFLTKKTTAVLTNVPGPVEPVSIGGHAIQQINFWVPAIADIGLGLSILSYNGRVQCGVSLDKAIEGEPREIVELFQSEFESLRQLAEQQEGDVKA